ncbi:MAG: sigma-70 factor domain-containing protein, partial [Dermatophilaceae bacterium]
MSRTTSEPSAFPPEFAHTALQALVRKGRTAGSVTGEEVAEALHAADVRAARGRVVLRALSDHGIAVSVDATVGVVAAARATSTKRATARTKSADSSSAGSKETGSKETTSSDSATAATRSGGRASTTKKTAQSASGTTSSKSASSKSAGSKGAATGRTGSRAKPAATDAPPEDLAAAEDVDIELAGADGGADSPTTDPATADVTTGGNNPASSEPAAVKGPDDAEDAGFVIRDDDEDDAPAQQVVTAGATADPVKDYLKQIGKVALLNAEQEVE